MRIFSLTCNREGPERALAKWCNETVTHVDATLDGIYQVYGVRTARYTIMVRQGVSSVSFAVECKVPPGPDSRPKPPRLKDILTEARRRDQNIQLPAKI